MVPDEPTTKASGPRHDDTALQAYGGWDAADASVSGPRILIRIAPAA